MNDNTTGNIKRLAGIAVRYLTLQLDYARLTATEKLIVLLSTVAFFGIVAIFGFIALVFISIGIGHWLSMTVAPYTAYLFVSAFYIVVIALIVVFRKQLIFNPVSPFLTRLFLTTPEENDEK